MPTFTDLDPNLIASFWIYFVGSFCIGIFLGILLSKLFFQREKNLFKQEKELYKEKLGHFQELEKELINKDKQLQLLQEKIVADAAYWSSNQGKDSALGINALYDIVRNAK